MRTEIHKATGTICGEADQNLQYNSYKNSKEVVESVEQHMVFGPVVEDDASRNMESQTMQNFKDLDKLVGMNEPEELLKAQENAKICIKEKTADFVAAQTSAAFSQNHSNS
jgi:hypothetical protein